MKEKLRLLFTGFAAAVTLVLIGLILLLYCHCVRLSAHGNGSKS